jgi:hypothetical protein
MFGFTGRKRVGQSADVERRSLRAGAARRARVLTTALLVLAGPIASLWVGVSPAAAAVISQIAPFSNTVTTTASAAFTDQLNTTGQTSGVTYTTTSTLCGVLVSASGHITTTPGGLSVRTCTVSGNVSSSTDTTASWTYTLTVTAVTITQNAPTTGSVTTTGSSAFTSQLATTGPSGLVSFVTTSVACGVLVSSSGAITTTGSLHSGSCVVSGTDSDTAGDTAGAWTYTLTIALVTIAQNAPTSGSVTTTGSSAFTGQLATTGSGTVSFVTTSTACGVLVSSSGAITTTGSLHTGSCTASGTDSDTNGDTAGNWFYTLATTAVTITQSAPTTGTTNTAASAAFTGQLATTGSGTVSFVTTSVACGVVVSSAGVITTGGSLSAGSCTVSGTDSDTAGDTAGAWTYILTINSVTPTPTPTPSTTITQGAPMTGWTTPAASAAFKAHLATTGQGGSVSFVTTSWACWIDVSSSGAITATRGLKPGHCTIRGTDSDTAGDTGTWTYTLTIGPVTITQRAPMTGWTTRAASARFKGHLAMNGRHGHVWFVTTSRSCGVAVSPSGAITTKGRLKAGHCTVWGIDTGSARTWGRWTFTLTVRR